jgi:hypothetical protein
VRNMRNVRLSERTCGYVAEYRDRAWSHDRLEIRAVVGTGVS